MKPIRMRTIGGRSTSLLVVALALALASPAIAQPKQDDAAEPEIEIDEPPAITSGIFSVDSYANSPCVNSP